MGKREMVRLGDIVEKPQSGEWGNEDKSGTGVPVLRTTNFKDDGVIDYTNVVFREISSNKFEKKALRYGDIIIEKSGGSDTKPVGRVVYYAGASGQYIYNNFTACLRVNIDNVDTRYLFLLLLYYYKSGVTAKYENKTTGIHNLRLNDFLSDIKIPFPPLDEQKRIAKNLDLASEIVKGYKEQLAELNKLVQSVFYEMFGDPVTNEKGWEVQSLQSVCDVRDGTHDSPAYIGDGYPLVTSKNVSQGYIDFSTANLISHEDLVKINQRSKVDNGDIIMPMIGTIGNPVIVNVNQEFAVKNVAIIKFAGSIMCNTFIKTLLSSSFFENAIQKANRGGTQKFIALGDIRKLPIPIPPSDVQTRFAEIVTEIEAQKAQVQLALTEAENLFSSLMQEYFE